MEWTAAADRTVILSVAEPAAPILHLSNLGKRRGEQGEVRFELRVPEFRLLAGQFAAIVGASGCGKSTLLDILAMVLKPSYCKEFWLAARDAPGTGVDIWALWNTGRENQLAEIRRRDLGYVLQTGGLMPFLSVEENIRLPVRLLGRQITSREIARLAGRLGIGAVLSKKPQYLSGGQRQRTAILRALIHQPRLILADEPTAAVDKTRAREIVNEFKTLARDRKTTIVMVTHDYDLVRNLADVTYTFDVRQLSASEVRSVCYLQ